MKTRIRRIASLRRRRLLTEDQRQLQLADCHRREKDSDEQLQKISTSVEAAHEAQLRARNNDELMDLDRYERHLAHISELEERYRRTERELRARKRETRVKSSEVESAWRERRASDNSLKRSENELARAEQRHENLDVLDRWMDQQENDK